jgi:hypothetical protein
VQTIVVQFANADYTQSLSDIVDDVIMQCPIDVRRALYDNVVLSGGSTMFKVGIVVTRQTRPYRISAAVFNGI